MARAPGAFMDIRRLLSAMAIEVHDLTPNETFERIAQYACVAVDASDSGIMLRGSRGQLHPVKGTSDLVEKAHILQAECGEGPCLEAIRGIDSAYVTNDAPNDPRWPTWGARVAELGFRSIVSVRLATNDRVYGSLNAYSASVNDFTSSDLEVMRYLAAHASAAIAASQNVEHLNFALESRNQIGQAQGILMLAYGLEPDGAFQYLRRLSQHNNTRLAEVAKQVVAQRHDLRKNLA
jgi:GAF domain-containing protein